MVEAVPHIPSAQPLVAQSLDGVEDNAVQESRVHTTIAVQQVESPTRDEGKGEQIKTETSHSIPANQVEGLFEEEEEQEIEETNNASEAEDKSTESLPMAETTTLAPNYISLEEQQQVNQEPQEPEKSTPSSYEMLISLIDHLNLNALMHLVEDKPRRYESQEKERFPAVRSSQLLADEDDYPKVEEKLVEPINLNLEPRAEKFQQVEETVKIVVPVGSKLPETTTSTTTTSTTTTSTTTTSTTKTTEEKRTAPSEEMFMAITKEGEVPDLSADATTTTPNPVPTTTTTTATAVTTTSNRPEEVTVTENVQVVLPVGYTTPTTTTTTTTSTSTTTTTTEIRTTTSTTRSKFSPSKAGGSWHHTTAASTTKDLHQTTTTTSTEPTAAYTTPAAATKRYTTRSTTTTSTPASPKPTSTPEKPKSLFSIASRRDRIRQRIRNHGGPASAKKASTHNILEHINTKTIAQAVAAKQKEENGKDEIKQKLVTIRVDQSKRNKIVDPETVTHITDVGATIAPVDFTKLFSRRKQLFTTRLRSKPEPARAAVEAAKEPTAEVQEIKSEIKQRVQEIHKFLPKAPKKIGGVLLRRPKHTALRDYQGGFHQPQSRASPGESGSQLPTTKKEKEEEGEETESSPKLRVICRVLRNAC